MRAASDTGLTSCAAGSTGCCQWRRRLGIRRCRPDGDFGEVGSGLAVVAQLAGELTAAPRF
jgi:hypothetical protein